MNYVFYFDETPGLKLNFNNIKGNNINLLELIKDNYMSLKYVNSSIPCERCKQYLFELKTRIARLPKILIIVLQKTNETLHETNGTLHVLEETDETVDQIRVDKNRKDKIRSSEINTSMNCNKNMEVAQIWQS